jgi:hypothetical protein
VERGTFSNYPQNPIVVRTNIVLNLAIIGESQYVRSYRFDSVPADSLVLISRHRDIAHKIFDENRVFIRALRHAFFVRTL